jgi:hypothetical protein
MEEKREVHHRKRPITEIGRTVPGNFKFGIIVTIAVLWAQFLKALLDTLLSFMGVSGPILSNFLIAGLVSVAGYLMLMDYRKIRFRLKKIKV